MRSDDMTVDARRFAEEFYPNEISKIEGLAQRYDLNEEDLLAAAQEGFIKGVLDERARIVATLPNKTVMKGV